MKAFKATDPTENTEMAKIFAGSDNVCSAYAVCYDFKLPHDSREAAKEYRLLRSGGIDAVTLTPFTVQVNGLLACLHLADRALHLSRQPLGLSRQSNQPFQPVVLHTQQSAIAEPYSSMTLKGRS